MEPGEPSTLTTTQREQLLVEKKVDDIYSFLSSVPPNSQSLMLELWRDKHVEYLTPGLRTLGPNFHVLDANRPWICYWILHSLALLDERLEPEQEVDVVDFLGRCQDPQGGYGGGPGQLPHLATTYAAVNSLITIGGERALSSINRWSVCSFLPVVSIASLLFHFLVSLLYYNSRDTLHSYLRRMKQPSGAFRMHDAGEMDVRACYTAISVASVLNILDSELVENVGDYILSCQTYEGGIAGEPGSEAHGGYTFCGLAALILINEVHRLDLPALVDWVTFRQGIECGFQGRTNKLVDGCYSFWQGGVLALIQRLSSLVDDQIKILFAGGKLNSDTSSPSSLKERLSDIGLSFLEDQSKSSPLFHSIALQQYVLLCSQIWEGGFRDKPGKNRDFYHTCYCLSGLSLCQYSWIKEKAHAQLPLPSSVLGTYDNVLEPTHPLFNVVLDKFYEAHNFFSSST